MPLLNYGILKGRVSRIETEPDDTRSPHVHVTLTAGQQVWVAAVNVKSRAGLTEQDKWLLFHVSPNFRHPITSALPDLAPGFHRLPGEPLRGLDYVRQNLVRRDQMRALPPEAAPSDDSDDLNEALHFYLTQARKRGADCYVFGEATEGGPEADGGLHDIHLNQGSDAHGPYAGANGTYQDGGLLIHHRLTRRSLAGSQGAGASRWVALFLAFQAQSWHTDDQTGHALPSAAAVPADPVGEGAVRIIAARLASGSAPSAVTLLNATAHSIDLSGWRLCDANKFPTPLRGILRAGQARGFRLRTAAYLHPRGGYVSLLDARGWKVDGVSYTAAKVRDGGVIVF